MPFVRFSRDRRGYEHVYLVDSKEHGRSRVIYWFRTPPGVKVGRNPFDPTTQRSLEQQYPDVTFDWAQIVAARMPPPTPVENWREKRRAERAFKRARAEDAVEAVEPERLPAEPMPFESDSAELDEDLPGGEPVHFVSAAPETGSDAQAPSNPVSGTRRERRRRRRGHRPERPVDAASLPSSADGVLDPAEPLEKPSNEG